MRATQHSARLKSSARHNDRAFDTTKTSHIDPTKSPDNSYYNCYKGMSFKQAERQFYKDNFAGMIKDINSRAEKSRHLERKTNADKLLSSKKTMPEEVIFQIGDRTTDAEISIRQLKDVFNDFYKWHQTKFGAYVKTLNISLHADEPNGAKHVHVRRVWTYQHENGYQAIGQHKALEQMGYELPEQGKERSRYNNLKQVYTAECREKWLDICHEHGFEVEREPENRELDKQNLQKGDYVIMKQEETLQNLSVREWELQEKLDIMEEDKTALEGEIDALKGKLEAFEGIKDILKVDLDEAAEQLLQKSNELSELMQDEVMLMKQFVEHPSVSEVWLSFKESARKQIKSVAPVSKADLLSRTMKRWSAAQKEKRENPHKEITKKLKGRDYGD